jgi:hypothetical protein
MSCNAIYDFCLFFGGISVGRGKYVYSIVRSQNNGLRKRVMTAAFTCKSWGYNILQPWICKVVSVGKSNDEASFVLMPP